MNSSKTKLTNDIIENSIKPDKLFYIFNTPILNKKGCDFDGIQKHLLYILQFSRKYPNSGRVRVMLSDLDKRISKKMEDSREKAEKVKEWLGEEIILDDENDASPHKSDKSEKESAGNDSGMNGQLLENVRAMSAIAAQIAVENVNASHYALRVISLMLSSLADQNERRDITDKVFAKLSEQHNSEYNQLWLQNMTYMYDKKEDNNPYSLRLCRLVMGEMEEPLWNNSWLKKELTEDFPYKSIVDIDILKKSKGVITFRERRAYEDVRSSLTSD